MLDLRKNDTLLRISTNEEEESSQFILSEATFNECFKSWSVKTTTLKEFIQRMNSTGVLVGIYVVCRVLSISGMWE